MTLPEELDRAVREGDVLAVRGLLAGADEAARKASVPVVKRLSAQIREGRLEHRSSPAAAVARAGTYAGAAAVATALRNRAWAHRDVRDDIVAVLLDRNPRWLPDLVTRLAAVEPPDEWSSPWSLTEALRVALGLPRPRATPYLRGLASSLSGQWTGSSLVQPDLPGALRTDDELLGLVLELLQVPDIGGVLAGRDRRWVPKSDGRGHDLVPPPADQTWPGALAALADDGLLDREDLLDTALDVLLRGGKRDHLALFLSLHEALRPSLDDIEPRLRTYVSLLADGGSPAASAAQRRLRGLDEGGRLDVDSVLDASRGALARPEKGIAVAQLVWLEKLGVRHPDRGDDVALALADAFAHERRDVQERALTALRRTISHAALAVGTLEHLRVAAAALPPTLHADASDVLGALVRAPAPDPGLIVGPAPVAEGPLRDLGELVDAIARCLETGDLRTAERVLDGVAALAPQDPGAVRSALEPFRRHVQAGPDTPAGEQERVLGLRPTVGLVQALLVGPPTRRGLFGRVRAAPAGTWVDPPGVAGCLSMRAREVAQCVLSGQSRRLLALPASLTGAVDPDRVLAALEDDARVGAEAWLWDLEQAALRLPPLEGAQRDRLARCNSPAARWLHGVLAAGLPAPVMELSTVPTHGLRWGRQVPLERAGLPIVDLAPPPTTTPGTLIHTALTVEPPLPSRAGQEWWESSADDALQVMLTLPTHREVIAAHLTAQAVATDRRLDDGACECLALLPEASGATGPATALALGYAAANGDITTRTAAVDALHGFAGRGGLDAAATGRLLGHLLTLDELKVGRVAATLGEATLGPARGLVWELVAAALPAVFTTRRRGVPELVAVAADAAAAVQARGMIDGLDAVAAGSSRLAVQARQLRAVLGG